LLFSDQAVAEELRRTSLEMGTPLAVLSDEGTELKGGMDLYRQQLPSGAFQPPHLHDIKHKAATFLKNELPATESWDQFVKHLTRTKLTVTLNS
jgi:hypothetical protein